MRETYIYLQLGDKPLRLSGGYMSQFKVVSMQFHLRNLGFYPNYLIISKKNWRLVRIFRKLTHQNFYYKNINSVSQATMPPPSLWADVAVTKKKKKDILPHLSVWIATAPGNDFRSLSWLIYGGPWMFLKVLASILTYNDANQLL